MLILPPEHPPGSPARLADLADQLDFLLWQIMDSAAESGWTVDEAAEAILAVAEQINLDIDTEALEAHRDAIRRRDRLFKTLNLTEIIKPKKKP